MSGFMSGKFLRYAGRIKEPDAPVTIEDDVACDSCGYNLRGLQFGQRCPECGHLDDSLELPGGGSLNASSPAGSGRSYGSLSDPFRKRRPLIDLLGGEGGELRARWQFSLTITSIVLLSAIVLRFGFSIVDAFGGPLWSVRAYVLSLLVLSVGWNIAMFRTFTRSIERYWSWLRMPRRIALWTQPIWIPSMALWLASTWIDHGLIAGLALVGRVVAGLGVCAMILVWRQVAVDAELNATERRLNACLVFLPIASFVGFFLMAAFGINLAGIGQTPESLVLLIGSLPHFLGFALWAWAMFWLFGAVRRMADHARWTTVDIATKASRPERVARKRAALQARADAQVRPLRATNNDEIGVDAK